MTNIRRITLIYLNVYKTSLKSLYLARLFKQNITKMEQKRRDFLKTFGTIAGTSLILSSLPWIKAVQASATDEQGKKLVRIGVIGTGSRAMYLLGFLKQIQAVEITALCDDYKPHLNDAFEFTGGKAKIFADYKQLLELQDLDAVFVTTPLHLHAQITIDALNADKHVFCEKSMAKTPQECKAMLQTHYDTGKILQIGHQRMFDLRFLRGIDWIASGKIGPVTQIRAFWHRNNDWRRTVPEPGLERKINWRLYKDYSCGLMTELASHHIQVANWVLGAHPVSVMGSGSINYWKDGREVYDNVNLIYEYPNSVCFLYDSLISNKKYGMEVQVMGPKGTLEMEIGKVFSENPPPAPGILQLINQIEHQVFAAVPVGGPSWVPESATDDKGDYLVDHLLRTDGSDIQLEAFIQSVRENKPISGLAEQGFFAGVAALIGNQAMETQQKVNWPTDCEIPYLPPRG
jgi:predicted dehydrogenase